MSSVNTWYNWRVIISATQQAAFVLRTDVDGPPTVGPNGEPIDTAQSRVVDFKKDNSVTIQEMGTVTGQRYQTRCIKVTAAPNQMTTVDTQLPYEINLICVRNLITENMGGDFISWLISPNTIAGVITQAVNVGDTVIHVSGSLISNAENSWRVRFISSTVPGSFEDVGNINSMDEDAGTITLSTPVTQARNVGDYVAISGVYVETLELPPRNYELTLGLEIPRTAYIPANTTVRCEYTNTTSTEKVLYCYYSYYYGKAT